MKKKILSNFSVGTLVLLLTVVCSNSATRIRTKITDTDVNEQFPKISGENIAWSQGSGPDQEIFLFDQSGIKKLTDNDYMDESHDIFGNKVVWLGQKNGNRDVFYYDGNSVIQLTDTEDSESSPKVSGNNVVWVGREDDNSHIFLYNGAEIKRLSQESTGNSLPHISGNRVIWRGWVAHQGYDIFIYDGTTTRNLSNSSQYSEHYVSFSGDYVSWIGGDGFDTQVFLYDGNSIQQITSDDILKRDIKNSANRITWKGSKDGNADIFYYDGSAVTKLTDSPNYLNPPEIDGKYVVWSGKDETDSYFELFFFDGENVHQLTDTHTQVNSPQISGDKIVYYDVYDTSYYPQNYDILMNRVYYTSQDLKKWDVDENNKVGLPDAINSLKAIATP